MSICFLIVCYKRLNGIRRLLSSLEKVNYDCEENVTLIFSIDYSDSNKDVRTFADNYEWNHGEKIVIKYENNLGLKKHILKCGDLTSQYDALVVLEDDIYVSPCLVDYVKQSVDFYKNEDRVAGISLYAFDNCWINTLYKFQPEKNEYDTYFLRIAQSWGQIWTFKKWNCFKNWLLNYNVNIKDSYPSPLKRWSLNSSWLLLHNIYCIENNKYFVYPYIALSTNFSEPGTHSKISNSDSQVQLQFNKSIFKFPILDDDAVKYDEFMERDFLKIFIEGSNENVELDLYGQKKIFSQRYIISSQKLNYKILSSYALSLKPIERNVINNILGDGLYLYDTQIMQKNKKKIDKYDVLKFYTNYTSFHKSRTIFRFSFCSLIHSIINKIGK